MKHPALAITALSAALLFPAAARSQEQDVVRPAQFAAQHPTFETYWYQGQAELSRYRLEQSRYGEIHDGEAVLIYVTEDFHRDLQVKWEHGDRADAVPILKLNAYRRFYTGIYPYSILTSVFAPVSADDPNPLKISTSVQEWCGHAYSQLNRRDGQYDVTVQSYFQAEADQRFSIPEALSEDGLFTRVRLAPDDLPVGPISLVPAAHYVRLMHGSFEAQAAVGQVQDVPSSPYADSPARLFTLTYTDLDRTLRIWFEPQFPHQVLAWEEEQPALFNRSGGEPEILTTRAVLTNAIILDYWRRNSVDDAEWREILGLTM